MQEKAIKILEYVKSGIAKGIDPTAYIRIELEKIFLAGKMKGVEDAFKELNK